VIENRLEVADVFRQHEQEFFRQWGHMLNAQQRRAFRDICACRTAALGAHVEQCDQCMHQAIAYNHVGIAAAQNASRHLVISGWLREPPNFCPFLTVMLYSPCRSRSPHWRCRINP
jgi:hypothetical protein